MSRALQLAVCIQEVEQFIKKIDDRNQICGLLVTAMSTMESADDRAHYYDCFNLNEDRRIAAIKELNEKTLGVLLTLNTTTLYPRDRNLNRYQKPRNQMVTLYHNPVVPKLFDNQGALSNKIKVNRSNFE